MALPLSRRVVGGKESFFVSTILQLLVLVVVVVIVVLARTDTRTLGRAHSCVLLWLDVPISHALHRSRCSRCFRRPFALRFSTFIDFSDLLLVLHSSSTTKNRLPLSLSLSLSLFGAMCIVRGVTLPGFVIIAAVRISLSRPAFVSVLCS